MVWKIQKWFYVIVLAGLMQFYLPLQKLHQTLSKYPHVPRFICIRVLCRVFDFALLLIFVKYYGESASVKLDSVEEFWRRLVEMFDHEDDIGIRIILGIGVFHYTFDFFGQRLWAFRNQDVWTRNTLYDWIMYLMVRWSLLFAVLSLINTAHQKYSIHLVLAGAIFGSLSLVAKYAFYYLIFKKKHHLHFVSWLKQTTRLE